MSPGWQQKDAFFGFVGSAQCLALTRNRNLIDLCCKDKIVFRETADGVGPKFYRNIAVACDVQIRVVSVFFGNFRHLVKKSIPAIKFLVVQSLRMR